MKRSEKTVELVVVSVAVIVAAPFSVEARIPRSRVKVGYLPERPDQKAVSFLHEQEACQAVRRAVNAWLYA